MLYSKLVSLLFAFIPSQRRSWRRNWLHLHVSTISYVFNIDKLFGVQWNLINILQVFILIRFFFSYVPVDYNFILIDLLYHSIHDHINIAMKILSVSKQHIVLFFSNNYKKKGNLGKSGQFWHFLFNKHSGITSKKCRSLT